MYLKIIDSFLMVYKGKFMVQLKQKNKGGVVD